MEKVCSSMSLQQSQHCPLARSGSGKQRSPSSFHGRCCDSCPLCSLVWPGGVSWRGPLFCHLRQDTTLLWEGLSFWHLHRLWETKAARTFRHMHLCTTAVGINKDKRNTVKLCQTGTLSLKVTQVSVYSYCWRSFPPFQLLTIFSPWLV